MPRSDVKPLNYMELEAFLESLEQEKAQAAREQSRREEPEAEPEAGQLEFCPHCSSKLTALDHKFGLCTTCNKPLTPPGSKDDESSRRPVSIGI